MFDQGTLKKPVSQASRRHSLRRFAITNYGFVRASKVQNSVVRGVRLCANIEKKHDGAIGVRNIIIAPPSKVQKAAVLLYLFHMTAISKATAIGGVIVAAWIEITAFDKSYQTIISKGNSSWRLYRNQVTNQTNSPVPDSPAIQVIL